MGRDDANRFISVRLDSATIDALNDRAAALGMTRSDLLRVLIALPVALDVASSKGSREPAETFDEASAGAASAPAEAPSTPPADAAEAPSSAPANAGEVLLLTDKPLRDIRIAIDRWGQNYNQSVRALNRLMRRFGYRRQLTEDEFGELLECLRACARSNEKASAGIKQVHEDMKELIGRDRYDMRSAVAGQERRTRRTGAEDYAARAARASKMRRNASAGADPDRSAAPSADSQPHATPSSSTPQQPSQSHATPAADPSQSPSVPPADPLQQRSADPAQHPARRKRKRNRHRSESPDAPRGGAQPPSQQPSQPAAPPAQPRPDHPDAPRGMPSDM